MEKSAAANDVVLKTVNAVLDTVTGPGLVEVDCLPQA